MTPRFPHPLVLLTAGVLLAAALSHVVPAGEFERRLDPVTKRSLVVGGTYHAVPAAPIGLLGVLTAIPRGIIDAADVLAVVFLVGAAFVVLDRTGALRAALSGLVERLGSRASLAIPICCIAFAAGGALENMQEEIIGMVPVLVMLATRVGANGLTAAAMSLGAAAVGAAFSPVNPFQVVIAQQVADVPIFSGSGFRLAVLVPALGVWIWGVLRYARATKRGATKVTSGEATKNTKDTKTAETIDESRIGRGRTAAIMGLMLAAFAAFIIGLARYGWGFNELSAVFFAMGLMAGLVGGLGLNGTAVAFVDGFRDMAYAALLIGFARSIYVVLTDAHIVDTIVNTMFTPLAAFPAAAAAVGMIGVHTLVHVAVPSVSGQAVLTIPILAPLSDLLHIGRQVTILAYQFGAGLCELLTPTNGALMAVLAAADVRYEDWLRFVVPVWGLLMLLSAVTVIVALAIGLG